MTKTSGVTSRRVALVIFALLSLGDVTTLVLTDGETPPYAVAAVVAGLGLVSLVLTVRAFRHDDTPLWLLVGLRVLSALIAAPAFFASDVPAGAMVAAAGVIILTSVGVLLAARGRTMAVAS